MGIFFQDLSKNIESGNFFVKVPDCDLQKRL